MRVRGGGADAKSIYAGIYQRLFADKYVLTRCSFFQFFVENLLDVSRFFEADLLSVVVLAIIGQLEIQAHIPAHPDGKGSPPPADAVRERPPRITTSCIAEISGIPRETVRRKIAALARRGWIERDAQGLWRIKTKAADLISTSRELIEIDRRQTLRVCRFLGQMHALAVESQKRKPGARSVR